jgi:hypothetical protein
MARRTTIIEPEDAIDGVSREDTEEIAVQLSDLMSELRSVTTDDSDIIVYKAMEKGGKWAYIKTLQPPIETNSLLEDLRVEWGGGEYFFRVRAKGKIVTTKRIVLAGDPTPKKQEQSNGGEIRELLPLLLNTSQKASSDNMTMMMAMMSESRAASERQSSMMMGMFTAIIPALVGGKTDPAQMFASIASAMQSMKPDPPTGGGMKDTLELLATAKGLFGDGGGGGGSDDIFTAGLKTFGPAVAEALTRGGGASAGGSPSQGAPLALPHMRANPNPPMVPAYRPRSVGVPIPATGMGPPREMPETLPAGDVPAGSPEAILSLIREDVLFLAGRNYPPDLAAEAVLHKISEAQITTEQVNALVIRFAASPDWLSDLAAHGIDLRQRAQWANAFLGELVQQFTDNSGGDTDSAGEGGRETDASQDEEFSV